MAFSDNDQVRNHRNDILRANNQHVLEEEQNELIAAGKPPMDEIALEQRMCDLIDQDELCLDIEVQTCTVEWDGDDALKIDAVVEYILFGQYDLYYAGVLKF